MNFQSKDKEQKNYIVEFSCKQVNCWLPTYFKESKSLTEAELLISPYIILHARKPRTPDIQDETGRPIYFWNRLLNAVVLQKTDFDFVHDVSRTKQNSVKLWFSLYFNVLLQFHNFFCERTKIFLGAQKYHHFELLIVF